MKEQCNSPSPIAIGGLGGSGTRVVAEIVEQSGIYMGECLNSALDNLWFSFLFKRPAWLDQFPKESEISVSIGILHKAMTLGLQDNITKSEQALINALVVEHQKIFRPGTRQKTADSLIFSSAPDHAFYKGWGWKEPNTHIFLGSLLDEIPNLKYIHVIRNGLDMAVSKNQQQLLNWGSYLGVNFRDANISPPELSLEFWIRANQRAIKIGLRMMPHHFYLLNYDLLCSDTYQEIVKLAGFLNIEFDKDKIEKLVGLVKPSSIGRIKSYNEVSFSPDQIIAVRELGFDV